MTQDGLAEKIAVSRQSIISWEQYEKEPNIKNIIKLSQALRIGIATIIKDYGTHYNNKER